MDVAASSVQGGYAAQLFKMDHKPEPLFLEANLDPKGCGRLIVSHNFAEPLISVRVTPWVMVMMRTC